MKSSAGALLLFTALAAPAVALEQLSEISPLLDKPYLSLDPESGWGADGGNLAEYVIGMTRTAGMAGAEAAVVAARPGSSGSWNAGLMRAIPVEEYRGKRVRLTARLKSQNVRLAQMLLRFDTPVARGWAHIRTRQVAAPVIDGTTDWQRMELVADIPADARNLAYGFYIRSARGAAFADSFKLEAVERDIPTSQNYLASYTPPNGIPMRTFLGGGGYANDARMERQPYE